MMENPDLDTVRNGVSAKIGSVDCCCNEEPLLHEDFFSLTNKNHSCLFHIFNLDRKLELILKLQLLSTSQNSSLNKTNLCTIPKSL